MSKSSDADFDLELHFLPAWAQKAPEENRYAQFEGEVQREGHGRHDRRGPGRDRGRDRDRDRQQRRPAGPGQREFKGGPPSGQAQQGQQGPRGPRPGGPREQYRDRDRDRGGRRGDKPPAPPLPLPEINLSIVPDEKGVDLLARQIKMTGRAYPLFEIAQMILAKPERHNFTFSIKKNPEGQPVQPLFVCALDDTLWLSEDEAVQHLLSKHFNLFYQPERTQTEPPKGVYTFVAQCGMSGIILGPPNYHDYQNNLRKLHAERFSKMPFDAFKARVKIVRDEAVVKKWIEDQSWKTEYICLNLPEPLKLTTRDDVEKHFRQVHLANVIKSVESTHLSGVAARNLTCPGLRRAIRQIWEDQRRFPLQVAMVLSQQFASRGLQFFKVNKTLTHVAVARPHYLDLEAVPVSEGVRQIVNYINANPKCTRRKLIEVLAPTPAPTAQQEIAAPTGPVEAVVQPPAVPVTETPVEGETTAAAPTTPTETVPPAPAAAAPAAAESAQPTPEQTVVISDLHWLIHQGHVIEFANGTLETAKKPIPKPPKPAPAQPAATEGAPVAEGTVEPTGSSVEATAPSEAPAAPVSSENLETPLSSETIQPAPEAVPASEPLSEPENKPAGETPAQAPSSEKVSPEPPL